MNQTVDIAAKIKVETITTTPDRIKNVVQKYKKERPKEWKSVLGLVVTSIGLMAADMKNALGISSQYWSIIFIVLFIASLCWLIGVIFFNLRSSEQEIIEKMIREMKMEPNTHN